MKTMSATEARVHFGAVLRHVDESGEVVIVERNGREVVAIVPIDEYRRMKPPQTSKRDLRQMMQDVHARIREEIGDRELTPADEMIRQMREENDARFDLP